MIIVKLREQKKVALMVFFSLGFFIYGVAQDRSHMDGSTLIAKQEVKVPQRGIASE